MTPEQAKAVSDSLKILNKRIDEIVWGQSVLIATSGHLYAQIAMLSGDPRDTLDASLAVVLGAIEGQAPKIDALRVIDNLRTAAEAALEDLTRADRP